MKIDIPDWLHDVHPGIAEDQLETGLVGPSVTNRGGRQHRRSVRHLTDVPSVAAVIAERKAETQQQIEPLQPEPTR